VYDGNYDGDPDNVVEECGLFNYVIQLKAGYEDRYIWEHCWGKVNAEDKTPPRVYCPDDVNGLWKKPGDELNDYDFDPTFWHPPVDGEPTEVADSRYPNPWGGLGQKPDYFNWLTCVDFDKIYRNTKSYTDESYPWYTGSIDLYDDVEDCSAVSLVGVKDDVVMDFEVCPDRPEEELLRLIDRIERRNPAARQVLVFLRLHYWALSKVIEREFTVVDEKGNESSCYQYIYFQRPFIHLPECKLEVDKCEFEGDASPEALVGDYPYAAPFFYNGVCEKVYLTDHVCNFTIGYEDRVLPGPENCGEKIIRSWTILDWCWRSTDNYPYFLYGGKALAGSGKYDFNCYEDYDGYPFYVFPRRWESKKFEFEQAIVIGDTKAPVVECPKVDYDWDGEWDKLSFSTGPFNCTAVVNPPAPVVKGECMDWTWDFELWGYVTDPKTGLKEYTRMGYSTGGVLNGVEPGYYTLKYVVTDACGNTGYVECEVEVADKIEPVAVCDDDLNISIGGAYTTAEGLARVTAADVDEGSWDNCELASLEVRRDIDEVCLDIYTDLLIEGADVFADLIEVARGDAPSEDRRNYPNAGYFYYTGADADNLDALWMVKENGVYYSTWEYAVYFTCCDISADDEDKVELQLRATDAQGNSNMCWLRVRIEDKLPPKCETHDKYILCTELDFDPADADQVAGRFGSADDVVKLVDNCSAEVEEEVVYTPGNCGTGEIERIFTITDANGRSTVCTQTITIKEVNDYKIIFPGDSEAICGEEPLRDIETESYACDILAVNRDTSRFEASGDECFKLLITYTVINWCEYDGENLEPIIVPRDWDDDDDLEEDHCIRVTSNPPVDQLDGENGTEDIPGVQVVTWSQEDGDLTWINQHDYENDVAGAKGYWQYTQLVKVYDDVAPEIEVENEELVFCAYGDAETEDCGGQVDIVLTIVDECTPDDVELRSVRLDAFNGGDPQDLEGVLYTVTKIGDNAYQISGKLPVGEHTFVVSAADGCGNLDGQRIPFEVKDCKSPAPICIQTLSVDLMPVDEDNDGQVDGGMNTVWAVDFLASDIDDCSPFEDEPRNVKYYAFKDSDLPDGIESVTPDSLTEERTSVIFTCEDEGTVLVYVIALDAAGNWDYCAVMAVVQPGISPSPCGEGRGAGSIAGLITDETEQQVEGVTVSLSGQMSMSYQTDASGTYAFEGLIEGYDYSVTPSMDENHLNGVSTFDLVLISKHILGVKPLDSPYKLIAADVNNSQSITTLDLIQLRKLILSVDTKFSNNTSWRFVSRDYAFPNATNPWNAEFAEVVNINNLPASELLRDFVAIKIGDVNGNARANALVGTDTRNVSGTLELDVADATLRAGEEYTIAFRSGDIATVEGYQFTLTYDRASVDLVDIVYGVAQEEHFGVFASEGAITTSWNGEASAEEVLFSVVLRAKADAQLSRTLDVSSRLTAAEAYDRSGEVMDVALNFGQGEIAGAGFELYQNQPNPFVDQTLISFNLPSAARTTIRISDINGRVLQVINGDYNKGYNELRLEKGNLPAGVLTYTVETSDYSGTRKMISVK
jgi:hypothetical protein